MTIGSILLGLALFVLVGLYIARPLMASSAGQRRRESRYNELLAAKESYLIQIRNLDFDYQTGKIPEEVNEPQRAELMANATEILKMLDDIEEAAMITSPEDKSSETPESSPDIDSDIEAAVLRMRHSHHAPGSVHIEPEMGEAAASAVGSGEVKFCPQCGNKTDPDDKFCVNCGAKLIDPQPV